MSTISLPSPIAAGTPPVAGTGTPARRRRRRIRPDSFLCVVPAVFLVVGMFWYSIVMTVWLSFTNSNGLTSPQFVGLANYRALVQDPDLSTNIYNTLIWAVAMIVLPVGLGLTAAVMLRKRKGRGIFQTVFYLPYAIGFVTTGVIWS